MVSRGGGVWVNTSAWIAIYSPIFVLFFIILPQQSQMRRTIMLKSKRRKGLTTMTNEILKKYVGKICRISSGSFGTNVIGKIIDVNENWIEIETKKGSELINAEYIQSIKEEMAKLR